MKVIPGADLIAPRLAEFAAACGETLARAHARTGDPVAIDAYMGKGPKFAAASCRSPALRRTERAGPRPTGRAIADGTMAGRPG